VIWWPAGLPGMDGNHLPDNQELANRVVAIACADRLEPIEVTNSSFRDTKTGKAAEKYLIWLRGAEGDRDSYLRRLALALASSQPVDSTPDKVLRTARTIHGWISRPAPRSSGAKPH
jgi:hypothetical protein